MKIKNHLAIGLITIAAALPAPAQNTAAPAAAPTPPAVPALTDAQLVEEFGWFIAKRVGLPELQFNPAEVQSLVRGFSAALSGKEAPYDLQSAGPQMDILMQRKQAAYLQKVKQQNTSETTEFFNKLKENKNVVELPSGLRYEVIKPGSGAFPTASDTVTVNYTGKLINGTVFDSSVQRGKPAEFPLSQVIPGWTEGIQKVAKGGTIKLYVPPQLGYGDSGRPGIPPGSTLVFEVELIDVKAPPAAPAAQVAPVAPVAPKPAGN